MADDEQTVEMNAQNMAFLREEAVHATLVGMTEDVPDSVDSGMRYNVSVSGFDVTERDNAAFATEEELRAHIREMMESRESDARNYSMTITAYDEQGKNPETALIFGEQVTNKAMEAIANGEGAVMPAANAYSDMSADAFEARIAYRKSMPDAEMDKLTAANQANPQWGITLDHVMAAGGVDGAIEAAKEGRLQEVLMEAPIPSTPQVAPETQATAEVILPGVDREILAAARQAGTLAAAMPVADAGANGMPEGGMPDAGVAQTHVPEVTAR